MTNTRANLTLRIRNRKTNHKKRMTKKYTMMAAPQITNPSPPTLTVTMTNHRAPTRMT